jgi:predicted HD phosphohydrolase
MELHDLLDLVLRGRDRYDGEEVVDDLAHALQTAALAMSAGADADLVGAALLHDVGHHPVLTARFPLTPHERLGADLIRPVLGERAAWVVGQHVAAKRHLAATDPAYAAGLSPASRESLIRQGGPAVLDHLVTGWGPDALRLRRWDDLAKVPGAPETEWEPLVRRVSSAAC